MSFDIPLPLTGTPGVECRGGQDLILAFTFTNNPAVGGSTVQVVSANLLAANSTATISAPTCSGMECTVNLANVTDLQTVVVNLEGAHDSKNYINVTVPVTIFYGDVTGGESPAINATDVSQVKLNVGTALSASNCRNDVNRSGAINATDVSEVKLRTGTSFAHVPPPAPLPRLEVCLDDPTSLCKSGGLGKFFWLGDTCWWLMNAEDKDVLYYLHKRREQGFNGIQIMALMLELRGGGGIPAPPETQLHCKTDFYGFSPLNTNGDPDPTCENSASGRVSSG